MRKLAIALQVHLNAAANANISVNLRRNFDPILEILNTLLFSYILTRGIKTSEIFVELCDRYRTFELKAPSNHCETSKNS